MKFIITPNNSNLERLARSWGYKEIFNRHNQKTSFIKQTGSNPFPRFHLYLTPVEGGQVAVDLHMDLLRPLHKKVAQASESRGDVVAQEAERIKGASGPVSLV